ncbi:MAG: HNH endonuclease [Candidatus Latescibacteria bacterium]|nr:HNH endonuclease [Candidatus Latescibacterota bacterium]
MDTVPKMRRNPAWQRDELILALDLYFRHHPAKINKDHPEVQRVSEILNSLPIHPDRPDPEKFRNPNGVYMKLGNYLAVDPSYHGVGLTRGGRLEQVIWDEFACDPEHLRRIAEAIFLGYQTDQAHIRAEEDEQVFPEGKILYRIHRVYERNQKLVNLAKEHAKDTMGNLVCDVCTFDFAQRYGKVGEGFIECHHTVPVSELGSTRSSRLEDVALVCANCHRILHRKRPWLGLSDLQELIISPNEERL